MEINKYLFGASGHAKVVLDVLFSNNIKVLAVIDDNPKTPYISTIPVVKTKDFEIPEGSQFIVAVGDNSIRKEIVNKNKFQYFSAFHSDATISAFASIEEGTIVMPQVVVNSDAKIGKHCIINSRSVVEHDCVLEDYVHVSPNASLAGNVTVGEGSHIGIGASVIQGVKIGRWVTIGAGAVVTQDIPDNCTAVGIPAKPIKFH